MYDFNLAAEMASHAQRALKMVESLDRTQYRYETESDWGIEASPLAKLRELASKRCHAYLIRMQEGSTDTSEPLTEQELRDYQREVYKVTQLLVLQTGLDFGMMSCWTDSQRQIFETLVDMLVSIHSGQLALAYAAGRCFGMKETADAAIEHAASKVKSGL